MKKLLVMLALVLGVNAMAHDCCSAEPKKEEMKNCCCCGEKKDCKCENMDKMKHDMKDMKLKK